MATSPGSAAKPQFVPASTRTASARAASLGIWVVVIKHVTNGLDRIHLYYQPQDTIIAHTRNWGCGNYSTSPASCDELRLRSAQSCLPEAASSAEEVELAPAYRLF